MQPEQAGDRHSAPRPAPGATAGLGRRVLALFVDWALCSAVAFGFWGSTTWGPLIVFAVSTAVLVGTVGSTLGHRVTGLVVRREDGAWAGPVRAVVRTVVLCLVLPAVIVDREQRGLHDRWARTVIVRL